MKKLNLKATQTKARQTKARKTSEAQIDRALNGPQHSRRADKVRLWLLVAGASVAVGVGAQTQPNGTTVYRCIDSQGMVSFSDAPCAHSVSHRLRIEHSLIQSVPISMEEQQRLRALESRLSDERDSKQARTTAAVKRRRAEANADQERCSQAKLGLSQIKLRKKRGYPVGQSRRIDNEEEALLGEINTYCES